MKKYIILLICGIAILQNFVACQEQKPKIEAGIYRAVIESKGGELPFGLEFKKIQNSAKLEAFVINGQEELKMDELEFFGDSVKIPMDVFDAVLVAKISKGNLYGYWKKKRKKDSYAILPFSAKLGQSERFESGILPKINVTGKWETVFISDNGKDTTVAVGVFKQNGARVEGTFLTTTGDYRYLAGNVAGDSLKLSCFDGTHLFLFKAVQKNGQLNGKFWSGTSSLENWTAKPNANAKLPDVKKLTYLKSGYDGLRFSFPDLNGKMVSLNDDRFKNKVVVVQILGSWCPNCMDESNFLAPWYQKNKNRGVEIIGLAYEKSSILTEAKPQLERMIKRFGISYPILLAGLNDKDSASATLPMLNKVIGFPTMIVIDKNQKIRQIHTGFAGPGTGQYYDEIISDFDQLMDKLIVEKPKN